MPSPALAGVCGHDGKDVSANLAFSLSGSIFVSLSAPHLVYVATPHGFGHAAILTAVMAAVEIRFPHIRQTVVTTVPEAILRERLPGAYDYVNHGCPTDFGMVMSSSTEIRLPETLMRYRAAHRALPDLLAERCRVLSRLKPSVVIASASYTAIAAASALGVPAITLGPFLWHDIIRAYAPHATDVLGVMADLYQQASAFGLTSPFVPPTVAGPTPWMMKPIGLGGWDRTPDLIAGGVIQPGERVVFASLGGIAEPVDYGRWQCPPGWRLLTQADGVRHGLRVSDLIASASAIVTKPGYGTYVEAALAGARLISRDRPDWPESAGLLAWFRQQGLQVDEVAEDSFNDLGPLACLADESSALDRGSAALHPSPLCGEEGRFGVCSSGALQCAALLAEQTA